MILLTHILLVVVIMILVVLSVFAWMIHDKVCQVLFIAKHAEVDQVIAGGGGGDLSLNDLDEAIEGAFKGPRPDFRTNRRGDGVDYHDRPPGI